MSGRRGAAAGALAGLLAVLPAQAVEHWSGEPGSWEVHDSAKACFLATMRAGWTAVATGVGAVTVEDPDPVLEISSRSRRTFAQHFVGGDAESTTSGTLDMCVGGIEGRAVSGWAVYSLVVHQLSGESAVVVQCTFSRSGRSCR